MKPLVLMKSLILLMFLAVPAHADELLVCYPGGSVSAKQAEPAIGKLLRVMERLGGEPAGSLTASFERDVAACRKVLTERRPPLAILGPGLFLEHREAHHLLPLVRPVARGANTETLRVVVRKGTVANLSDLKGKKLTGTPLEEAAYLKKVVFAGAVDPTTELVPETRALKALKRLQAGELDAVLVNDAQHAGLADLPFAGELVVIHTFAPQPLVGLVADETRVDADRRRRLTEGLTGLCNDGEGKTLCEVFGLDRFEAVDASVYADAIRLWSAP